MNDNVSRIALVLIALAVSAFAVKAFLTDDDPAASNGASTGSVSDAPNPESTTTGGGGEPGTFDPLAGGTPLEDRPETAPATTAPAEPPPDVAHREVGPPLSDGTPVDTSLRFVPGTVSRYRIVNVIAQRDRSTGQSIGQRWTHEVTTTVSGVRDDGTARIRVSVDAVRVEALFPDGLQVDFDSRSPDDEALSNRDKAVVIKPLLAIVGIPVEFRIGPNGGCVEIEGLDAWQEAWTDVVEALDPGSSRSTVCPYNAETVRLEWSEHVFPPILGGMLKAGETRDVQILRDTLQGSYVEFRGPLKATHDDGDVFRLSLVTTPGALTRQGAPRSPQEAAVARVHVQSDADAYYAAWRFQRDPARLVDAEIDTTYQLWVSWKMGEDPQGEASYRRVFLDVERVTRVELLPD